MQKWLLIRRSIAAIALTLFFWLPHIAYAEPANLEQGVSIDRVQLVTQQINLLKNRLIQSREELTHLQQQQDKELFQLDYERFNKHLLDKASLDIAVAKSNLDSVNIELDDSQQTMSWLEKNVQEIENQLNVLNIFGAKIAHNEFANIQELRSDLTYQQKLLQLEKVRFKYLQDLQTAGNSLLQLKKEQYNQVNMLLKSRRMLHVKQQQIKDELIYQEQQNDWLQRLNNFYSQLAKIDPVKSKNQYSEMERSIFYANESANFAYVQSLLARYKDQIQQINLAVTRNNSISLLNEMSNQVQILTKQINRLNLMFKNRLEVLEKHQNYLAQKKKHDESVKIYLDKLGALEGQYKSSTRVLVNLNQRLAMLRSALDQSLQSELALRQGLPNLGVKTWIDLGKEMLLVPALTFQIIKSLPNFFIRAFHAASFLKWFLFILIESLFIFSFFFLYSGLKKTITHLSQGVDYINFHWIGLQWLKRNMPGFAVIGNFVGILFFFNVPLQNFISFIYPALVLLSFNGIIILARLCLVETTHDTAGHDVKLYYHLKWVFLIGGVITALTVFVHQLPLIYELKAFFDRIFLLLLLIVSLLLLKSWEVVPNIILSRSDVHRPYFQKSIRLLGILIPFLFFTNALVGLLGFVNLILTISWYEGVFLIVLVGYLILRGLLSAGMEQLFRFVIQYVNNGWLWTEAFLKPLDTVLRIALFLAAWVVLFLFYGWDQQSPIVERLTGLLHYKLISVLNTAITPLSVIELLVIISVFYWTARWTREFVYRLLSSKTEDMGIRNSIAILSQYSVIVLGAFICLRVLGINLGALTAVAAALAFGVGLGLRDLANNFVCGFLLLLERPLRVGDIVSINDQEGEVVHIGSRAVAVRTWDHMELLVPNAEIFSKSFMNWTAKDNIVRTVVPIKISRYDNPHAVKTIIQTVLMAEKEVLKDPAPEVLLKEMSDVLIQFELRYYVNIRQIKSRVSVTSAVLLAVWDAFAQHGIKPPYPQHEVYLKGEMPLLSGVPRTS